MLLARQEPEESYLALRLVTYFDEITYRSPFFLGILEYFVHIMEHSPQDVEWEELDKLYEAWFSGYSLTDFSSHVLMDPDLFPKMLQYVSFPTEYSLRFLISLQNEGKAAANIFFP